LLDTIGVHFFMAKFAADDKLAAKYPEAI
jgi:hypothetical protein